MLQRRHRTSILSAQSLSLNGFPAATFAHAAGVWSRLSGLSGLPVSGSRCTTVVVDGPDG